MRIRVVLIICFIFVFGGCSKDWRNEISNTESKESQEPQENTELYYFAPIAENLTDFFQQLLCFKDESEYLYVYTYNDYSNDSIQQLNALLAENGFTTTVRFVRMPDELYLNGGIFDIYKMLTDKNIPVDVLPFYENDLKVMEDIESLVPWNEYLETENGKELQESIPTYYWARTAYDGVNYGPGTVYLPEKKGWLVNYELMKKYDITKELVSQDIGGIEPVLKLIAEKEGSIVPLAFIDTTFLNNMPFVCLDRSIPIGFWIGSGDSETCEVLNLFETPEMKEICETINRYYLSGYLEIYDGQSDFFMMTDWTGNVTYTETIHNLYDLSDDTEYYQAEYYEKSDLQCLPACINAVPKSSKRVDEAMDFLFKLHTNEALANVIRYGVEGVDYVLENGMVEFPDGVWPYLTKDLSNDLTSSPVSLFEISDKKEVAFDRWNAVDRSKLTGFVFDPSAVQQEVTQIASVYTHLNNINNIFFAPKPEKETDLDWEDYYNEMQRMLDEAGIDVVIEEMNRQIEEYLNN